MKKIQIKKWFSLFLVSILFLGTMPVNGFTLANDGVSIINDDNQEHHNFSDTTKERLLEEAQKDNYPIPLKNTPIGNQTPALEEPNKNKEEKELSDNTGKIEDVSTAQTEKLVKNSGDSATADSTVSTGSTEKINGMPTENPVEGKENNSTVQPTEETGTTEEDIDAVLIENLMEGNNEPIAVQPTEDVGNTEDKMILPTVFAGKLIFKNGLQSISVAIDQSFTAGNVPTAPDKEDNGKSVKSLGWGQVKNGVASIKAFVFTLENINALTPDGSGNVYFEPIYAINEIDTGKKEMEERTDNTFNNPPTLKEGYVKVHFVFPNETKTDEILLNTLVVPQPANSKDFGVETFRGWFVSQNPSENESPFDFSTQITTELTLYAVFTPTKAFLGSESGGYRYRYYVEQVNGWPTGNNTINRSGKKYVEMTNYAHSSNTNLNQKEINGLDKVNTAWKDKGNTYQWEGYNKQLQKEKKIDAYYRIFFYSPIKYLLTFNLMAENVSTKGFESKNIAYGVPLKGCKPKTDPQREGYSFDGWYKDSSGLEAFDFTVTMAVGGMTAYAKWKAERKANVLRFFDQKGGTEITEWQQEVMPNRLPENKAIYWQPGGFVPGRGIFIAWGYGAHNTWQWMQEIFKDYDLYATWRTTGFKVTYDLNGGLGTKPIDDNSYDLNMLATVANTDATMQGAGESKYVFYAWKDEERGKIYHPFDRINISETGDITLTAQYIQNSDARKIVYHRNKNNQDEKHTIYIKKGVNPIILADNHLFTDENSDLIGWNTKKTGTDGDKNFYSCGAQFKTDGQTSSKIDFYGIWKSTAPGVTVTFKSEENGHLAGEVSFADIPKGTQWNSYFDGGEHKVPTAVPKEGYYFIGWAPALPEGEEINASLTFTAMYKLKTNICLFATPRSEVYNGEDQTVQGYTYIGAAQGLVFKTDTGEALVACGKGKNVDEYDITFNEEAEKIKVYKAKIEVTEQYNIALTKGIFAITPETLTVKAEDKNIDFGDDAPIYTYKITGFKGEDIKNNPSIEGSPELGCNYKIGDVANTYKITVTVDKMKTANYTFASESGALTVASIFVDITTLAALDKASKTYGNEDPNLNEALSWETLPTNITKNMFVVGDVTRKEGENIGPYAMEARVAVATEYQRSIEFLNSNLLTAEFTITPAAVRVSLGAIKLSYGDPIPNAQTHKPTIEGFVYSPKLGIDDHDLKEKLHIIYVTDYVPGAPVVPGGYPINILASFDKPDQTRSLRVERQAFDPRENYVIQASEGDLVNLLPKDIAVGQEVYFKQNSYEKTYSQEDPNYELVWSEERLEEELLVAFTREDGENVGEYKISFTLTPSENLVESYNITGQGELAQATLKISPLKAHITANDNQKKYGDKDPTPISNAKVTFAAIERPLPQFKKDDVVFNLVRPAGEKTGTYAIDVAYATNENLNYLIDKQQGTFTIEKGKLPMVITLGNMSKIYGSPDPDVEEQRKNLTVENLLGEDTVDLLNIQISREKGENAGQYAYKMTYNQALAQNYSSVVVNAGYLLIEPATLTVKARDAVLNNQEDVLLDFAYTISGFQRSEEAAKVLVGQPKVFAAYKRGGGPGEYQIKIEKGTLANAANENYRFNFIPGTLRVRGSELTPTAKPLPTSTAKPKAGIPSTGDNGMVYGWLALVVIAAIGLMGAMVYRKKKYRK